MDNSVRLQLGKIIDNHGVHLCQNYSKCESLFQEYLVQHPKELYLLINALRQGIVKKLVNSQNSKMPKELVLGTLSTQLQDRFYLTQTAAHWTVETWGIALKVIDANEWPPPLGHTPPLPHHEIEEYLKTIIKKHSPFVCHCHPPCPENYCSRKIKGYLQDYCPKYSSEISLLINTLEKGSIRPLINSNQQLNTTAFTELTKELENKLCLIPEAAQWSINTWLNALQLSINTNNNQEKVFAIPPIKPIVEPINPPENVHQKLPFHWIAIVLSSLLIVGGGIYVFQRIVETTVITPPITSPTTSPPPETTRNQNPVTTSPQQELINQIVQITGINKQKITNFNSLRQLTPQQINSLNSLYNNVQPIQFSQEPVSFNRGTTHKEWKFICIGEIDAVASSECPKSAKHEYNSYGWGQSDDYQLVTIRGWIVYRENKYNWSLSEFPKSSCGDKKPSKRFNASDYSVTFYPVNIPYNNYNLSNAKKIFCKDAYVKKNIETGGSIIQIASFLSQDKALAFSKFVSREIPGAFVGPSKTLYK